MPIFLLPVRAWYSLDSSSLLQVGRVHATHVKPINIQSPPALCRNYCNTQSVSCPPLHLPASGTWQWSQHGLGLDQFSPLCLHGLPGPCLRSGHILFHLQGCCPSLCQQSNMQPVQLHYPCGNHPGQTRWQGRRRLWCSRDVGTLKHRSKRCEQYTTHII
jgi:hypothetical protein